ncbi:MAG: oligosaccharide flippase family protein [Paraprevotella sp.]|nr:oligosaccharide flippase family protein [Paraprevotella sp.]
MNLQSEENSKRIAKNTLLLYGRMLVTMWISLYTSRMVLDILGVTDYGIYNVVGGVIALMWSLNGALSASTTRHITFELGRNDNKRLQLVFGTSLTIHGIISLLVILVCETIGLWFLCTQMTIPVERMEAAHWVYQFSLLFMVLSIMSVPFNACIIAHERMNIYAYISIIDVLLKLVIVFFLEWLPFDKLKMYALLYFLTQVIIQIIYAYYCRKKFTEVKLDFIWNKEILKEMASFAGWNMIGSGSALIMSQGHSILLNQFFGPVVNAAKGIANQVLGMVSKFYGSFQMALNPQIFKSYASQNLSYMHKLIFASSKYSYFMLFLLSLPIAIESDILLNVWLKEVPENTNAFLRLILLTAVINSLANPLVIAAQATGRIKKFQSVESIVLLLILPFTYISFKLGAMPIMGFYIYFLFHLIAVVARIIMLHSLIGISYNEYVRQVAFPVLTVSSCSLLSGMLMFYCLDNGTFIRCLIVLALIFLFTLILIFFVGLDQMEKMYVKVKVKEVLRRFYL